MSIKQRIAMLRALRVVFICLMIGTGFLLIKSLSAYFGFSGDGPFINGWVTMITEVEPVSTRHPDGTSTVTLIHTNHHKWVKIEFDEMGLIFKEKYLAYIVFHILAWVLGVFILYRMYLIIRNIEQGQIFQQTTVRHIRRIALALLGIPLLLYVSSWALQGIAYTFHGHQYVTEIPDLHRERVIIGAFAALLVFALGEIFRTGMHLKEEQEVPQ
ncbi:MAG: DUF2975 domain-containing protein [Saprospiraceae bacterium]|nr:DUF2975 domain-containing protein [Saprospiraceae bacterium]